MIQTVCHESVNYLECDRNYCSIRLIVCSGHQIRIIKSIPKRSTDGFEGIWKTDADGEGRDFKDEPNRDFMESAYVTDDVFEIGEWYGWKYTHDISGCELFESQEFTGPHDVSGQV